MSKNEAGRGKTKNRVVSGFKGASEFYWTSSGLTIGAAGCPDRELLRNFLGFGRLRAGRSHRARFILAVAGGGQLQRLAMQVQYAGLLSAMAGYVGQRQTGGKEYGHQDGGGAAQKVGGAGYAEQAAGSTAAESCAHVGALAMLQQNQTDDAKCGHRVYNPNNSFHQTLSLHFEFATRQMAMNCSATSEALPTSAPSMSGMDSNCAAFATLTLPP
jgi:hypothetical protein